MAKNKRPNNKHTPYVLEVTGNWYGSYETYEKAKDVAESMPGLYCVIRCGDDKIWES